MSEHGNSHNSEDHDLARLFDAQPERVPETLDSLILNAAKEAVSTPATTTTKRTGKAIKGWFAIAATLLLGITVGPLVLQSPESSLERSTQSDFAAEAVQESLSMAAEPLSQEMQDVKSTAERAAAPAGTPMSLSNPVMPAIQTQNLSQKTAGDSANPPDQASQDKVYRRFPRSWLAHIRSLIEDGLPEQARTEYDLFRKAFPNFAPEFILEE